jgi:hypothetical protein
MHCGGSLTAECSEELACQADGGTFDPFAAITQPDGSVVNGSCALASEAGPTDAPTQDSPLDSVQPTFDGSFCCNVNPDPCCQYLHCGGPLTAMCSEEMACQADGGTFDPFTTTQPDGSIVYPSCSFEAGPDAPSDHESPDAGDG